jgi:WD40 repeat protein
MLVYGVSGTGKSSLIHCGLANKFQNTDWLPIVIRRGGNIIESMAAGLRSASITEQQSKLVTPADFKKGVRSLYLDHYKPVFFIFDQFEELFIFGDKEERKSFVNIVKALFESELQCRLIFVMREEYMAGVTEFEKYISTFFSNRVRIEKMSHANALAAIKEPCKVFNISLEEGFAESLLDKLSPEGADVELTYLQVYLDKIFKLATEGIKDENEKITFRISDLDKAGNVYDILGSFLDEQISHLPDPELAMTVLKAFVSARGTKRPANAEEIREYALTTGKDIDEKTINELLHSLVNLRILQDKDHTGRNELRHDALAAKIFEKITLVEKELIEIRQLIENAFHDWQKRGVLLTEEDLQYIAPYESRLFLPEEHKKLIEKSKSELVKARRRRRNIFSAAAVLLIIILSGFSIWAVKERKNAIEKEKIANEERIKATASEQEAIKAKDNAIESDKKAMASEKEAFEASYRAKESELRINQEKEIAGIRERQAKANNFNFLSTEMEDQDPTIALQLGNYALSLDPENKVIKSNLIRIYSDNSFYKVFYKDKEGSICQISPDWTKIITAYGCVARLSDIYGNNKELFAGHAISRFVLDAHHISRGGYITSVAFSPDGNSILTGSEDLSARLWDLQGNTRQIFKGHLNYVISVVFSPDGKTILTGSADKTARLWDLDGKCLQVFTGHKLGITSVAFSPDGQNILTGSADSTARLWDLKGNTLHTFKGHSSDVTAVAFSPDGKTVLTGSRDKTARLWDLQSNTMQTFSGHLESITVVLFSPDGTTIVTGSDDNTAKVWDLNGNTLQTLSGHTQAINSIAFSPDGNKLLTFSTDGKARIWDLSQNAFTSLIGHKKFVYRAIFSPDGKTILTLSYDHTLKFWDLNGKNLRTLQVFINSMAFSPDGNTILIGLIAAQFIDLNGNILKTFSGHINAITSVAFAPDGKTFLTGSADKTARLWDLTGKTLHVFNGHTEAISSVAFSPDGNKILTGSFDNSARLWDLSGNTLQIFSGHTNYVNSIAFSPDGKTILTGSGDKTARLWDLHGNTLQIFKGHTKAVKSIAFSPDGKSILTGSYDKTARIWDLLGNTLQILSGCNSDIYSVSYSPDGKKVLIGSNDNIARLFSVKTPLNEYLKENRSEELSTEQKLQYEMIKIDQLIKEKDTKKLFEGLKFYIDEAKLQKDKKTEYIKNAGIIYKKLMYSVTDTKYRRAYIFNGIDLFKLSPEKYILDGIEKANRLNLSSSTKNELKEAYDLYSTACYDLDSNKIVMKLPEYFVEISGRLMSADTSARHIISNDLSCLSWSLMQNRRFRESLEAINLALETDSTNQYINITLPLALVLNDRFDEASKIYKMHYKEFIYKNYYKSNKLFYLEDIATLEKLGIRHPDFIRVKELLNR